MNTYSKQQLQEKAKAHLKKYGVKKIFATSDGQFFLLENRARLHAGKGNVYCIEDEGAVAINGMPLPELKEKVAGLKDLEELHYMMMDEIAGENRAEAIDIIDNRIQELVNDDNGNLGDDNENDGEEEIKTSNLTEGATKGGNGTVKEPPAIKKSDVQPPPPPKSASGKKAEAEPKKPATRKRGTTKK